MSVAASRYVLGVNTGPHDGSAALLRDGGLVTMIEQERLSRRRRAPGESPRDAIAACLSHEGIALGDISEVAVGWNVPALVEIEGQGPFDEREFTDWLFGDLCDQGRSPPPLRFVEHHLAHAASAFYTSGLREAAILIVDGRGESVATTIGTGGPGGIEILRGWEPRLSLGHFYGCAADWAGLTYWGSGKLMGLASYGTARQPTPLTALPRGYSIAGAPPEGTSVASHLRLLSEGLRDDFRARNYPFGPGDRNEVMAHANFAASIQHSLQETLLVLARLARAETGHANLVIAGGVALNCSANGEIIRAGLFDEVWIPPVPHDSGVSLGAALFAEQAQGSPCRRLSHACWAPDTGPPGTEPLSRLSGCEINRHGDGELADVVAGHLADGKLVAWWQGRAEVGQRALGARSVLCDPRERRTLVRANVIKGREAWRPLAPAVLADRAGELFAGALPVAADFMLAALPVRERAWPRLPAAVHVDGSARPQAVRPEQSRYHDVLEAFYERTEVPAVINTSFNLAGEPIVLSATDAVDTFLSSDLEILVLGDLVARKPQGKMTAEAGRGGVKRPSDAAGREGRIWGLPWIAHAPGDPRT